MKVCPKCGRDVPDENKFCTCCGESMEENSASVTEETVEENAEEVVEEEKIEADEAVEVAADENVVAAAEAAADENTEIVAEPATSDTVETQLPEPEVKKSGNGKKIGIIAGIVALVAVAGVSAAVVKSDMFKDPKEAVIEAFKSVYEEEQVSHLDEIFGFTELAESARTQGSEVGMTLKLDDSDNYYTDSLIGSGIEIQSKNDIENKKTSVMMGIQYQEMDLAHMDMYLDEKELMVAIPELFTKVFALNYADDLQGQLENSPMLGEYILDMGIELDAFSDYIDYAYSFQNEEDVPFNVVALWERYKTGSQAIENLKAAMTVTKGKKETRIVDGKEEKCRVYEAVIPGEEVISFFRTSSDFFLEDETLKKDVLEYLTQVIKLSGGINPYSYYDQDPKEMRDEVWGQAEITVDELLDELEGIIKEDITMLVYVDSKGRLAALEAETNLTADEDLINAKFTAALKGGEYLTQNVDLNLTMSDDKSSVVMTLEKEESYDGNILLYDLDASVVLDGRQYGGMTYSGFYQVDNGEYELDLTLSLDSDDVLFTMEGIVNEFEKGKMIKAVADSIRFEMDGEYVEFSGSYAYKPLEGDVTVPEGDQLDILAATESDWTEVMEEFYVSVMELYTKLQY